MTDYEIETLKKDILICKMIPADVPEVAAIERQCFSSPWTENGFCSTLEQDYSLYLVARIRETGQIVGYCGFLQSFEEAEILNVAVQENFRGRGIGYRLLRCLMEYGRKRGIRSFTLEVRKGNSGALHLYEKLGFTAAGIRKRFYEEPTEDAVIMWTDRQEGL